MGAASMMTLTTDDGEEITVHVIKFESVFAFELMLKMDTAEPSGKQLMAFRKDILSCTYVTRNDAKGERVKLEFAGLAGAQLDQVTNKAFRGTGINGLIKSIKFAMEVNFKSFLDEQRAEQKARRAEQERLLEATDLEASNLD